MKVIFRITQSLAAKIRRDLSRPHAFALERVGWITARAASTGEALIVIAEGYHPVADNDYLDDPRVGAMMGQEAIRKGLNLALVGKAGVFHVHMHDHRGTPTYSRTDIHGQRDVMPDFSTVRPELPHGAIVLSHDRAIGNVWLSEDKVVPVTEFNVTGSRILVDLPRSIKNWLRSKL